MMDVYEKVYTETDRHDGPRTGAANYMGEPHFYEHVFDDERDDWTYTYALIPMNAETLELELEAWGIWTRWEAAYNNGATESSTHPALPQDRARYDQIKPLLDGRSAIAPENTARFQGDFKFGPDRVPIAVHWTRVNE